MNRVVDALLLVSCNAMAQTSPVRPITIVVPFAAGGPVDTETRKYGARLHELGVQPDIPAINEHPDMKESSHENWQDFFARAGVPAPVINRLHGLLTTLLKQPELIAELESQASTPVGSSPAEFTPPSLRRSVVGKRSLLTRQLRLSRNGKHRATTHCAELR